MKIGISSCLIGKNVRYDGSNKLNKQVMKLIEKHEVIDICPELLSGFNIPHSPIEILNGKAINKENIDVSDKLNKGCELALEKIQDCDILILKAKSPSCGYHKVYDGTFSGRLIEGNGYFTSLVLRNNKKIFSEEDLEELTTYLKENGDNL